MSTLPPLEKFLRTPMQSMLYKIVFGNINLAPGHLKKRVKSQHSTYQNK